MFKGGIKAVVLLVVTILLIACSPKLDWRTVQSPQEGYTALFPAKPDKIERKVTYQAQELMQILEAVKIDEDISFQNLRLANRVKLKIRPPKKN